MTTQNLIDSSVFADVDLNEENILDFTSTLRCRGPLPKCGTMGEWQITSARGEKIRDSASGHQPPHNSNGEAGSPVTAALPPRKEREKAEASSLEDLDAHPKAAPARDQNLREQAQPRSALGAESKIAAEKLQAVQRGRSTRKKMKAKMAAARGAESKIAAEKLQAVQRGRSTRKKMKAKMAAATMAAARAAEASSLEYLDAHPKAAPARDQNLRMQVQPRSALGANAQGGQGLVGGKRKSTKIKRYTKRRRQTKRRLTKRKRSTKRRRPTKKRKPTKRR